MSLPGIWQLSCLLQKWLYLGGELLSKREKVQSVTENVVGRITQRRKVRASSQSQAKLDIILAPWR